MKENTWGEFSLAQEDHLIIPELQQKSSGRRRTWTYIHLFTFACFSSENF